MRKIDRFLVPFTIAASFSVPLLSLAQTTPGQTQAQSEGISYPSCTNDAGCASHPGEVCTYTIGSTNPVGVCALPDTIPNTTSSKSSSPASSFPSGSSGGIAQPASQPSGSGGIDTFYLQNYAGGIIGIINGLLVPVFLAIAFLTFLWGVFQYFILGAADEAKRAEGRQFILWSVIGFVAIFSVWGLVGLVGNTLGLSPGGSAPPYPTL